MIVAGGIFDKTDIEHAFELGADGVQIASRFVATEECDASEAYKQAYINAKEEDVQIIQSPVGMPGRAIRNPFLEHVENCPSCYDELETYFIVHAAMQQLDEKQEDTVLDFKELLEEDIRKSRRYIRKKKFHRAIAAVAVCVLIAALVVFLVFVILELKEGI